MSRVDEILALLPASIQELAARLGIRPDTVRRDYLMPLFVAGRIDRVRIRRTDVYYLPGEHDPDDVRASYEGKWRKAPTEMRVHRCSRCERALKYDPLQEAHYCGTPTCPYKGRAVRGLPEGD